MNKSFKNYKEYQTLSDTGKDILDTLEMLLENKSEEEQEFFLAEVKQLLSDGQDEKV